MKGFTYLGALACIGLFFFTGENVEYGIACSVVASIGFAGSLVFYNAFCLKLLLPTEWIM